MECPQCGNPNREGARFCDSCGTPLQSEEPAGPTAAAELPEDELPGLIDDRFEPLECLGRRGAKTVYKARDRDGGRDVAVALFDTDKVAATAQSQARREAQATARIGEHPNVVAVVASGEHAGCPYVASEYMPGGDLRSDLERLGSGPAPLERAIEVATDICNGLAHIHSKGVVHRDLKPAGIWLDEQGRARIGDFGLAVSGTGSGAITGVVGTAAYLPPEQALGRPSDGRADLYSLGCLLYELVTGRPPFSGDDAVAIISQHLNTEPVPVSRLRDDVPAPLDDTVARLLAKSPDDRPADAAEALRLLERALEGEPAAQPAAGGEAEGDLSGLASGVFVGREDELTRLRAAVDALGAGRGGLVLLVGEPGIGKTSIAEELATYASVGGRRVHWGRCHEDEAAPAYWPWAEALRSHVAEADPVGLRWELGNTARDVARIAPAVAERLGLEPSAADGSEGSEDRFRIFDSVSRFLIGASKARPIVLILEDLHWADEASLMLLRFLTGQLRDSGLLIVGTYRDVELGRHHPLAETLAEISQAEVASRVALHGLDADAIETLIRRTLGRPAPAGLAEQIRERTDGNPFFASEIVRLMASEGSFSRSDGEIAIPEGVRDVVGRRLDRLGARANELLRTAAAIGRDFDREVLSAAAGADPAAVEAALEAGVRERLIDESRRQPGRFAFAHALVRETLYAELSSSQRVAVHRAVGLALEERCGSEGASVAELARHFSEAAAAGEAGRAVEYSDRAAGEATAQLAHEDAVVHLTSALDALALLPARERSRELSVRLRLGDAQTRAGRFIDARATLLAAAADARELGDTEALARAVLALAALSQNGVYDEEIAALAHEALERVGDEPSGLRARLLSVLAAEEFWLDAQNRAAPMAREALEMARAADDPEAEALALVQINFVTVGADGARQRLADLDRLLEVAERCQDRGLTVRAHAYRLQAFLELGDVDAADREIAAYEELANELREPRHLWHVPMMHAMRATMKGRFAQARALSAEGFAGSQLAQEPLGLQFHVIQRSVLHVAEGTVEEMLPEVRRMSERYPAIPAWRMALVSFLCEADRAEEARPEFERLAAGNFEDIPKDLIWVSGVTRLADAACDLRDERRAATLYRMLLPFTGLAAAVGRGVIFDGPVDTYLGRLALTNGRLDDAVRHLEAAVALAARMRDRLSTANAKRRLGEALLRRDTGGDRARAVEILGEAIDAGQEIGMRRAVEHALSLRLEAQGVEVGAIGDPIDDVIESMSAADREPQGGQEERLTIVFSDIESSTLMTERLGDDRWIEVLREHNDIFRARLAEHGGAEVKNQGDGFMLAFADPADALEFAIGVQRDLDARPAADDERLRVRMGMHAGPVIAEAGDYFGRSVILAARIAAQARGGEVLVSSAVHSAVGSGEHFSFAAERELELKGLAGFHTVFVAEWQHEHETALA